MEALKPLIEIQNLGTLFDHTWVHKNLNLTIYPHRIISIIGDSGSGKTTLIREILMLQPVTEGDIFLNGENISKLYYDDKKRKAIAAHIGMMFQQGALFSALTVLENVIFPLKEYTHFSKKTLIELARIKLHMVGLTEDAFNKYPSQLSGGMLKRTALARTLALDPEVIFLDEPTAGLDPQSAYDMDQLILNLKNDLKLTVIMITHDLDTIYAIVDEVVYIGGKKVLVHDSVEKASRITEFSGLANFFRGARSTGRHRLTGESR
ncbi:MAG: ABC transporter ATP-binding protein [Francisellaceae bacterium]